VKPETPKTKPGKAEPRKTAVRRAFAALLFALLPLLGGCAEAPGRLLVMRANFMTARGMYTEAIALYMEALEHPGAAPYAEYGLGLIFFALGEDAAALNRFLEADRILETLPDALHRELRYRNHYNTGMVLFGKGDFDGAAESFRNALRISGGRIEAMRNLELSLMSIERESGSGVGQGGGDGTGTEAMALTFRHIQRREVEQWRNREWPEEEYVAGDDR